jgi:hypothetical protein
MTVTVCHVSGRISHSPRMTEDKAVLMAEILPQTIFFFEDEEE